jgi:hypothetical protein
MIAKIFNKPLIHANVRQFLFAWIRVNSRLTDLVAANCRATKIQNEKRIDTRRQWQYRQTCQKDEVNLTLFLRNKNR